MLEAAIVDLVFTISLKRSTLYRQLSTSCTADYLIFGSEAVIPNIAGAPASVLCARQRRTDYPTWVRKILRRWSHRLNIGSPYQMKNRVLRYRKSAILQKYLGPPSKGASRKASCQIRLIGVMSSFLIARPSTRLLAFA
jgi:hypothetical protein